MKIGNVNLRVDRLLDLIVIFSALVIFIVWLVMPHQKSEGIKYPEALRPGDKIAILSPAGPIARGPVDSAATVLRQQGYEVVIYPHTFGKNGHFSGTTEERFQDLKAALLDPEIRAILCARGGYGVVHNLDSLAALPLEDDPKWIIGFSDISALHALMASRGIASIHTSMAKQIALGADNKENKIFFDILQGKMPVYRWPASPYDHPGHAEGKLLGGNLAVIADLISTPFDIIQPGTILFIEDVSEPIYKIERILYQMRLNGSIGRLRGLIIGQFTDYKPDENDPTMEAMIARTLAPYEIPVSFGAPIGHVDINIPLVESSYATLDVTVDGTTLTLER